MSEQISCVPNNQEGQISNVDTTNPNKVISRKEIFNKSCESCGHSVLDWEVDYYGKDGNVIASAFVGNWGGPDNFATGLWVNGISYNVGKIGGESLEEFAEFAEQSVERKIEAQNFPYRVYEGVSSRELRVLGDFATEDEAKKCISEPNKGYRSMEIRRDAIGDFRGNKPKTLDDVKKTTEPFWKRA